ncbi:hypothetical protein [Krasilnikovia sp. MM14-A1259]|uniref:hypothetical protein n=1 Tax=Krasilnikovia sp. MM14-A1259 TaxID=3373539 RepID=UPI00380199D9
MPDRTFHPHVDRDDLARRQMSAVPGVEHDAHRAESVAASHHGAEDSRLAARQRSERDRSGRASRSGQTRTYAFRRS